jgi:hypothetical protein
MVLCAERNLSIQKIPSFKFYHHLPVFFIGTLNLTMKKIECA